MDDRYLTIEEMKKILGTLEINIPKTKLKKIEDALVDEANSIGFREKYDRGIYRNYNY